MGDLTETVLARLADTPSPRLRAISEALVRHLHAFVREVEPTTAEWAAAIDFLTRTGQLCSPTRQEFILLSDTLGVSMLVDELNHGRPGTTESTVVGPFYVADPPELALGADLGVGLPGRRLRVEGTVSGPDGRLAGAVVDTWQSDSEGFYDVQRGNELRLRGRFRTDAEGRFDWWTIVPSSYPIPDDGPVGQMLRAQGRHPYRPAHVHFRIAAPGREELVTHVFVAGDEYLDSDAVFGVKESLVRELEDAGDHALLRYDFVLA